MTDSKFDCGVDDLNILVEILLEHKKLEIYQK